MEVLGKSAEQRARELYEGDLYATPALARQAITRNVSTLHLPFLDFKGRRRNRAREEAKRAERDIPRIIEGGVDYRGLTGATGKAVVYVKRRVNNEDQASVKKIRSLLEHATKEGTYRAHGPGGWHVTIAKSTLDMEGASPREFADDIEERFTTRLSGLLVPIGGVAIQGAKVCGNVDGGHGSSRFIGLTPAPKAGLLENMREVKTLLSPLAETQDDDWYNTPHISIASANSKLFDLSPSEQQRLEGNVLAAVEEQAADIRPLTLTSLCVELRDPRQR